MTDYDSKLTKRRLSLGSSTRQRHSLSYGNSKTIRSRADEQGISSDRGFEMISPPPLKRQRTEIDLRPSSFIHHDLEELQTRVVTGHNISRRGEGELAASLREQRDRHKHKDMSAKLSCFFPARPIYPEYQDRSHRVPSRHDNLAYARRPSASISISKRTCRVCEKSSATNYNPIIICQGCDRPYHDSCRRPLLTDGVDPNRWRCYQCLTINRQRVSIDTDTFASSRVLSSLTSAQRRVSVVSAAQDLGYDDRSYISTSLDKSNPGHFRNSYLLSSDDRQSPGVQTHLPRESTRPESLERSGIRERSAFDDSMNGINEAVTVSDADVYHSVLQHGGHDLDSSLDEISKRNGAQRLPAQAQTYMSERTEIPNTPTQSSSQFDVSSAPSPQHLQHEVDASVHDDLPSISRPAVEKVVSLTLLCSICRKQRVLAKTGSRNVTCRNCRNRILIAQTGKLEIPETPDAMLSRKAVELHNLGDAIVKPIPASPAGSVLTPWFQSNLVASKPRITHKTVGEDAAVHTANSLRQPLTERDKTSESPQVFKVTKQVANSMIKSLHSAQNSPAEDTMTELPGCANIQSLLETTEQADRDREVTPLTVANQINRTVSYGAPYVAGTVEANEPIAAESTARKLCSNKTRSISLDNTVQALPGDKVLSIPRSITSIPQSGKRYTNRELARIALLAAGGSSLNSRQVIDWVSQEFSYLQRGEGAWEGSIKSALSGKPEFRADKGHGPQQSKTLYGFVDESARARYETEYAKYCTTPRASNSHHSGALASRDASAHISEKDAQLRPVKAIISALTKSAYPPPAPTPNSGFVSFTPERHDDASFMPFERKVQHTSKCLLAYDNDTKRETSSQMSSFHVHPIIDSMTAEEKSELRSRIQARPSRKTFFGSDNRLGHVRRYERQDIHDEREGAWKPRFLKSKHDGVHQDTDSVMLDGETSMTLQKLFDLPENAVPMNDGQTELAFRDGTLVNGKLPRSRQYYKVGKLFGGELTVRTS